MLKGFSRGFHSPMWFSHGSCHAGEGGWCIEKESARDKARPVHQCGWQFLLGWSQHSSSTLELLNWQCSMLHFRVNKQSSQWSRSPFDVACDSWIQLPCENLRTAAHQWTRFILSQRTSSLRSSSVCILDQVPPYATIAIRGYGRDYSSMSLLCRCWQEALAQRLGQSRLRRSALKGNWKTAGDNGSFGMHNSRKKKDKQQNDYQRWKCRVVLSRLPAVSLIGSALLGLSLPFQDSNSTRAGASGSNLNLRSSKYERSNADDDN